MNGPARYAPVLTRVRQLPAADALSRLERGLIGFILAEGEPQPDIYKPHSTEEAAGH